MKAKTVLKILGIHRVTLYNYVKSGKIRGTLLPNGTYNYNEDDVYKIAGIESKRKNVIYARVSTYKQKNDLENQIKTVENYMNIKGIGINKIYYTLDKSPRHFIPII